MSKNFYRTFEDKFRGSHGDIKSRYQVYLPFVLPLRNYDIPALALDLGCGRGEWLELVAENGFIAEGVDLDDEMLSSCRELGLKVHTGDALAFLRDMPDSSYAVITGFHVVEHIPFAALQELVHESLRVLRPGGLLILETPNPENLVVGSCSFYLDPTHQRPIPPQLLAFLPEFAGFRRSKILRLQESPELIEGSVVSLINVLNGVSPDYAVVAQKEGPEEFFDLLDLSFNAEYGLTLETLASKYFNQVESRVLQVREEMQRSSELAMQAEANATQVGAREAEVRDQTQLFLTLLQQAQGLANQAETRANQAETREDRLEAHLADLKAQLAQTQEELHQVHQANGYHWQLTKALQDQIAAIRASLSWRVTAPLRWLGVHAQSLVPSTISIRSRRLLQQATRYINRHPRINRVASMALYRLPSLERWLMSIVLVPVVETSNSQPNLPMEGTDLAYLRPRARQIFTDLKAAIAQQPREKG